MKLKIKTPEGKLLVICETMEEVVEYLLKVLKENDLELRIEL